MSLLDLYNYFFNYEISSYFAGILRILYCSFFLFSFVYIFKYIDLFSKPDGPYNELSYRTCKIYQSSLFNFNIFKRRDILQKIILSLFLISGVTSIIGFFTNFSILIFFLTYASIQARVLPIMYSDADVFARIMLFSLLLIDCGAKYSLDSLLDLSSNKEIIDGWSLRFIQFTLVGSYLTSSAQKIRDIFWRQGVALQNAVLSVSWGRRICKNIFLNPFISRPLNYFTIYFQLFFPFLLLINEIRPLAIFCALSLHLGMLIFLRIWFFAPTVILALLSFCNQYFKML